MPKCTIPLQPCQSSQLREFGHDPATNTLAIRFQGKGGDRFVYTYKNVPAELHAKMLAANDDPEQSVGKFFGEHIKGREEFPFTKVDELEPEESAT